MIKAFHKSLPGLNTGQEPFLQRDSSLEKSYSKINGAKLCTCKMTVYLALQHGTGSCPKQAISDLYPTAQEIYSYRKKHFCSEKFYCDGMGCHPLCEPNFHSLSPALQ